MSHHSHRSSAPLGVKVMALLVGLDGLLAVVQGLGIVGGVLPLGLLLVALGVLHLVVAYGLWQLEPYAYTWGMGIFGLGLVVDLLAGNLYGAGLSGINMYVLYHYRGLFRE